MVLSIIYTNLKAIKIQLYPNTILKIEILYMFIWSLKIDNIEPNISPEIENILHKSYFLKEILKNWVFES